MTQSLDVSKAAQEKMGELIWTITVLEARLKQTEEDRDRLFQELQEAKVPQEHVDS